MDRLHTLAVPALKISRRLATGARPLVLAATVLGFATTVQAQTIGIGTTKGGATAQISNAIANVVSSNGHVGGKTEP